MPLNTVDRMRSAVARVHVRSPHELYLRRLRDLRLHQHVIDLHQDLRVVAARPRR